MVAPSFQKMEMIGEPFEANGKMYIQIRNPKTGNKRQVRWYNEKEYHRLYPESAVKADHSNDPYWKPQKIVLGFEKGYITIFKGDLAKEEEWFRASICRYTRFWRWYVPSTEEVPADLPAGIEPVKLYWKDVCKDDESLMDNEEKIKAHVYSLVCEKSNSDFVGEIGQRLDLTLTVSRVIELDGNYPSTMHFFTDENENVYIWTTASKHLAVNKTYKMRGTIKDHRTYKNEKQTILTRCMNIQEVE